MTRKTRTILVLTLEAAMLLAMAASFLYFTTQSRDFIAAQHPGQTVAH